MRVYTLAAVGLAVLVIAPVAVIAGHHNHDGKEKLSPAERFIKTDINNDGFLTQDELKAAHEERMQMKKEKRAKKAEEVFAKADTNGDGKLSPEEAKAMHEMRKEKMRGKRGKHGNDE